ncbi:MAG: phosphoserine aminotransferase [Gammaproteobacteria bacterium]|jgi:phosphoserine aminotransferase|nr:phosphoserine aminotransferase [Gammaproteobacteria bacterium]
MPRVYNFSAGPATLPEEVLLQAQEELLNWHGLGMSIMEVGHRTNPYEELSAQVIATTREVLKVPDNYQVLYLANSSRAHFAMVPMNLLRGKTQADYLHTGIWSKMALDEAKRYCQVNIVASGENLGFNSVPEPANWRLEPDAAYVHYTPNETISGVEFHTLPEVGEIPLVADMTSSIMSQPIDISRFGLIYAGTQKNMGIAGLSLVIVRKDLLGQVLPFTPTMYDYQVHSDNNSLYNTPASFAVYITGLMLAWIKRQGGLTAMAELNQSKARKLYHCIDNSKLYSNSVDLNYRSRISVPFFLHNKGLEAKFLAEARAIGLVALKGHRTLGGIRACMYNAMPELGVDKLIEFMQQFEKANS